MERTTSAKAARWGLERGTELHGRAVAAAWRNLEREGFEVLTGPEGFECPEGSADVVASDGEVLLLADVFISDGDGDFPDPEGRDDVGAVAEAFALQAGGAGPGYAPIPTLYRQFHMVRAADRRATLRVATAPVVDGSASFDDAVRRAALRRSRAAHPRCSEREADLAAGFLARMGYEAVDRRGFSCEAGSADIVAVEGGCLVFVVVIPASARLEESGVDLEGLLLAYARENAGDVPDLPVRLDVVSVDEVAEGRALVRCLKAA